MRYAIYFTWDDGTEDAFNVTTAAEKNLNINELKARDEITSVSWCKIYASGEYGKRNKVK